MFKVDSLENEASDKKYYTKFFPYFFSSNPSLSDCTMITMPLYMYMCIYMYICICTCTYIYKINEILTFFFKRTFDLRSMVPLRLLIFTMNRIQCKKKFGLDFQS